MIRQAPSPSYREALAILDGLCKESPANPHYPEWQARTTSNLGLILTDTGKIEEAIETERKAVTVAEHITDTFLKLDALATCRNNLAEALEYAKRPAEAEPIFRQALGDYRTLASRFPNDIDYRWSVAMVLTNIAAVADQRGGTKEALGLVDEAAKLFVSLSAALGANRELPGAPIEERAATRADTRPSGFGKVSGKSLEMTHSFKHAIRKFSI